jgi:hypothetical protein
MQGAQKLRSEAHLRVRRNDEVAAQRSRWTFYETINVESLHFAQDLGLADGSGPAGPRKKMFADS